MATIQKRGEYQWRAQIRTKGYPAQYKTFTTRAEAVAWAAVIESEQARGVFIDRSEAERTTLGELIERYRKEITPHKKSADKEKELLNVLERTDLSPRYISTIAPKDVEALRDFWLEQRDEAGELVRGPSTVRRYLGLLGSIFTTVIKDWQIPLAGNPVANIRLPKESPARDRRLEGDEATRLLQACEMAEDEPGGASARTPWLHAAVVFAIETAARRSEIVGLEWKDVNLKKGVARLFDTKNGTDRAVPLSSRAKTALEGLPRSINGKVFPLSATALSQQFKRALVRAKIDGLTFHDLRHEAASRLFENASNLSVMEIASITGHKSLEQLQRYTHLRAEDLAKKLG